MKRTGHGDRDRDKHRGRDRDKHRGRGRDRGIVLTALQRALGL